MPGEFLLYDTGFDTGFGGSYFFPLVPLLNTEDNVTKEVDWGSVTPPKLIKQPKANNADANKNNTLRLVLSIEGFCFM